MSLLPLEQSFMSISQERHLFPVLGIHYEDNYTSLLSYLRGSIYGQIDTALATKSENWGYYTAHNAEHFDEVVRCAGDLVGCDTGQDIHEQLNPYELYLLLMAIRIHDAGCIHGREDHEKKCFEMMLGAGAAGGTDNSEKKLIANIAQAHGGKTQDGNRDTISKLPDTSQIGSAVVIRPRLIASIVRFADELSENRQRAANYLLNFGSLPEHSQIYHMYAASVASTKYWRQSKRVELTYKVMAKDLLKTWGGGTAENTAHHYLFDEILSRLEKVDCERRYCNMYSRELFLVHSVRSTVEILDDEYNIIETVPVPDMSDVGYPADKPHMLSEKLKDYCGDAIVNKLPKKNGGSV